jgi:hypothetical protein
LGLERGNCTVANVGFNFWDYSKIKEFIPKAAHAKNISFELLVPLSFIYVVFAMIKRVFIKTDYIPVKTEEELRHLTRTANINENRC